MQENKELNMSLTPESLYPSIPNTPAVSTAFPSAVSSQQKE